MLTRFKRPVLIYFREMRLEETNKFTLDFSVQGHVQPSDFYLKKLIKSLP